MEVKYIGETRTTQTVNGSDVTLENSKTYKCMEKEYHSAAFVRITLESGEHVKVRRSELQKV